MKTITISRPSARALSAIAASILFSAVAQSHEPPSGLLAHLTFDGSLADSSGNGFTAEMLGADASAPPAPRFVEGRFGQALAFDGKRSVRVPLDLHYDRYPGVTITGWLYLDSEKSRGTLVGTGSGDGPEIRIVNDDIFASHANGRNQANNAVRAGRWFFFAGSWDYRSGTNRLNWSTRSQTEQFETGELDAPDEPDVWIGAIADLRAAAEGVAVDDIRIYGRVLSDEELTGLQLGPDERISGTGDRDLAAGAPDVAGVADQADPSVPSSGDSDGSGPFSAGNVIDPSLLEELSADEVTALQREIDRLLDNASGSESSQLPEGVVADTGLEADTAAELTPEATREEPEMVAEAEALEAEQELRAAEVQATSDLILESVPVESDEPAESEDGSEQQNETAATGWHFSETDVQRTAVSGTTGDVVLPGERSDGLHSISIEEQLDFPCRIFFNDYLHSSECEGSTLSPSEELQVNIGSGTVGALAVCSNDRSNQRVKGIEIRGNDINTDGSLGAYWQDEDEHANCRQWESLVLCPTGYRATGLVGHYNSRRDFSNDLVGLQLICRRIVAE